MLLQRANRKQTWFSFILLWTFSHWSNSFPCLSLSSMWSNKKNKNIFTDLIVPNSLAFSGTRTLSSFHLVIIAQETLVIVQSSKHSPCIVPQTCECWPLDLYMDWDFGSSISAREVLPLTPVGSLGRQPELCSRQWSFPPEGCSKCTA